MTLEKIRTDPRTAYLLGLVIGAAGGLAIAQLLRVRAEGSTPLPTIGDLEADLASRKARLAEAEVIGQQVADLNGWKMRGRNHDAASTVPCRCSEHPMDLDEAFAALAEAEEGTL